MDADGIKIDEFKNVCNFQMNNNVDVLITDWAKQYFLFFKMDG